MVCSPSARCRSPPSTLSRCCTGSATRLPDPQPGVLISRHRNGELAIALWNPFVDGQQREVNTIVLELTRAPYPRTATVQMLDSSRGDLHAAYVGMGEPRYPTLAQYRELRAAARLPPPWPVPVRNGRIRLTLPMSALALVTLR